MIPKNNLTERFRGSFLATITTTSIQLHPIFHPLVRTIYNGVYKNVRRYLVFSITKHRYRSFSGILVLAFSNRNVLFGMRLDTKAKDNYWSQTIQWDWTRWV